MRDASRASHELRRSESKKPKLRELSNNISEKRCELKANERAGILSDLLLSERSEVSGKSGVYYIISVHQLDKIFTEVGSYFNTKQRTNIELSEI